MRRKSVQGNAAPDLRLVVNKPEPEHITKEDEALSAILERAVTYQRYLSRDSVGGERASETIRMKVTLSGADNPLSAHIARKKLLAFLTQHMGCPLAGADNERLVDALFAAEDARLIHLKQVR